MDVPRAIQSRRLGTRPAIHEPKMNVAHWMNAAGQVEIRVVWSFVKPKPSTIWEENYDSVS